LQFEARGLELGGAASQLRAARAELDAERARSEELGGVLGQLRAALDAERARSEATLLEVAAAESLLQQQQQQQQQALLAAQLAELEGTAAFRMTTTAVGDALRAKHAAREALLSEQLEELESAVAARVATAAVAGALRAEHAAREALWEEVGSPYLALELMRLRDENEVRKLIG
jgi:hypothetical protein